MIMKKLYEIILTSRWYVAEHCSILLDLEENADPAYKEQLKRVLNLIMNTTLLELEYKHRIEQNGQSLDGGIEKILTDTEILTLVERNSELSLLPIKN
jgi:hypothetical protein